jgi:peroxiredoxin
MDTISIGSTAPEFTLPASNGRQVALTDYRSAANVVLFFVREFN